MYVSDEDESLFWEEINRENSSYRQAMESLAIRVLRKSGDICMCKYDFTDGLARCQECGKKRKD